MADDLGKCSRCRKVLSTGDGPICSDCQNAENLGLDQETMKLWEESISPYMTSVDSIRSDHTTSFKVDPELLPQRGLYGSADDGEGSCFEYTLGSKLGSGGLADVYSANQRNIMRPVAIKMVKDSLREHRSASNSLLCEAIVTGNLDHPNVVPIYDLCVDEKKNIYFVMKEVHGSIWASVMAGRTLDENLDILLRVADTIAYAHSKGILHCDLKPQNIMLGEFGEVMVMDWGASCALKGSDFKGVRVLGDSFCGTPAYMPPEIAKGDGSRLGISSDVYQLGAILYHILSGHPPHCEKDPVLCLSLSAENYIAPLENGSMLQSIAMKAMSTSPADRYSDVRSFQRAIREYRAYASSLRLLEEIKSNISRAGTSNNNRIDDSRQDLINRAMEMEDYELVEALMNSSEPDHLRIMTLVQQAIREREAEKAMAVQSPFRNAAYARPAILISILILISIIIYKYF